MSRMMGMVVEPLSVATGFVAALQFVDGLLAQSRDLLGAGDAQGAALGFARARQALFHFGFVALVGRGIEISSQYIFRQILLRGKVLGLGVRIDIALPVTKSLGVAVGVFQSIRPFYQALRLHLFLCRQIK